MASSAGSLGTEPEIEEAWGRSVPRHEQASSPGSLGTGPEIEEARGRSVPRHEDGCGDEDRHARVGGVAKVLVGTHRSVYTQPWKQALPEASALGLQIGKAWGRSVPRHESELSRKPRHLARRSRKLGGGACRGMKASSPESLGTGPADRGSLGQKRAEA